MTYVLTFDNSHNELKHSLFNRYKCHYLTLRCTHCNSISPFKDIRTLSQVREFTRLLNPVKCLPTLFTEKTLETCCMISHFNGDFKPRNDHINFVYKKQDLLHIVSVFEKKYEGHVKFKKTKLRTINNILESIQDQCGPIWDGMSDNEDEQ